MSVETPVNEVKSQAATGRRGCLFYVRRVLLGFVIVLVVLALIGVTYQTVATEQDKRNFSPRGEFYTVNGHQMHIVCTGETVEGSPTVILQAGATAESLWWYWVQNQLAAHTQVCAYDRPGLGWSEPTSESRDALTLSAELHTLLEQAGISAPYVMAGHSYGAILTRIYAAQYPDEVAGIVLVDSQTIPAPFANQSEYDAWKAPNNLIQGLLWGLSRTGVARLITAGQFQPWGYPADIAPELAALQSHNQTFDTDYAERVVGMWSLTQASADAVNLGDMPMAVLWASNPAAIFASDEAREAYHATQEGFAAYSTNSVIRYVEGADHGSILGNEQYAQQVSDAVLDVIESAQTGEPLE